MPRAYSADFELAPGARANSVHLVGLVVGEVHFSGVHFRFTENVELGRAQMRKL
jgi:hypothetical protein